MDKRILHKKIHKFSQTVPHPSAEVKVPKYPEREPNKFTAKLKYIHYGFCSVSDKK